MREKEKTFLLSDSPFFLDDRKDYSKLFHCQCCEAANYENCPIIGHIGLWHGVRRGGMISDNKKLAIMHAIMRVSRCLQGIERRALLAAQWKRCRLFCSTAFVRRLLHRLSPWCVPADEARYRQTRICNMSSCVFYSATVRATRHAFAGVSFGSEKASRSAMRCPVCLNRRLKRHKQASRFRTSSAYHSWITGKDNNKVKSMRYTTFVQYHIKSIYKLFPIELINILFLDRSFSRLVICRWWDWIMNWSCSSQTSLLRR